MRSKNLAIIIMVVAVLSLALAGCSNVLDNYEHTLTIASTEGGTVVEPGEGEFPIDYGTVATLVIEADEDYNLSEWEGPDGEDVVEEDGEYKITIDGDKEILAVFSEEVEEVSGIENFESYDIGYDEFYSKSWYPDDVEAVVVEDPYGSQGKVLEVTINNYNAVPVIKLDLEEGKTLADYSKFVFKGYFAQGDVGYKDIHVAVYADEPDGEFNTDDDEIIGTWNRAKDGSSEWEDITIDIDGSEDLSGTVYVAFGMHQAGTGDIGGDGVETIWYADDVGFE